MFLENEAWELCPVKANFSLVNLQVHHFLCFIEFCGYIYIYIYGNVVLLTLGAMVAPI